MYYWLWFDEGLELVPSIFGDGAAELLENAIARDPGYESPRPLIYVAM